MMNLGKNFKYLISAVDDEEDKIEDGRETKEMLGRIASIETGIYTLSWMSLLLGVICVIFFSSKIFFKQFFQFLKKFKNIFETKKFICSKYEFEDKYEKLPQERKVWLSHYLTLMMLINSVLTVFNIFRKYLFFKFFKKKKMMEQGQSFLSGTTINWLFWESLLIFAHPSPYFLELERISIKNQIINGVIKYRVNNLFYISNLYKWILILKSSFTNTLYKSSRAYRVW